MAKPGAIGKVSQEDGLEKANAAGGNSQHWYTRADSYVRVVSIARSSHDNACKQYNQAAHYND